MSHKSPLETALDVFVFAPLGLLFGGPSTVERLAADGRKHLAEVGRNVTSIVGGDDNASLPEPLAAALRSLGLLPDDEPTAEPAPAAPVVAVVPDPDPEVPAPPVDSLAIPGYDSLSASQVVSRLPGLSADELEAVLAYEGRHRSRKTVLGKIRQLQV